MSPPLMLNGGCVVVFFTSNTIRESIVTSSETHLSSRTELEASDADALSSRSRSGKKRARTRAKKVIKVIWCTEG